MELQCAATYLPELLDEIEPSALTAPFWAATRQERLEIQHCDACGRFQWGPEWICHRCHSFDLSYREVEPSGHIYSWERVWHPQLPVLADSCPYLVVLVELPNADGVRLIGNLLGSPDQEVVVGTPVRAVFEHHPNHTLVQWATM